MSVKASVPQTPLFTILDRGKHELLNGFMTIDRRQAALTLCDALWTTLSVRWEPESCHWREEFGVWKPYVLITERDARHEFSVFSEEPLRLWYHIGCQHCGKALRVIVDSPAAVAAALEGDRTCFVCEMKELNGG